ncbi:MAG: COX15/CtaA family protein [Ferruginibacter sp.]
MQSVPRPLQHDTAIARWLLMGVGMIMIQVLLGGITRLTESGLSITEWDVFTGVLPPLSQEAWQEAFRQYQATDQFKNIHQHFTIGDFQWIFFWEWFHRLWARLIGVVFVIGFVYFLSKKRFQQQMVTPLVILFVLGAIQGAIGWIMVKSGLVPKEVYVNYAKLTIHLLAALLLLFYTLWLAFRLIPAYEQPVTDTRYKPFLVGLLILFTLQLMYGGFMAGLKAAQTAPTWPTINREWIPGDWNDLHLQVHFIHRTLAYVLLLASCIFFYQTRSLRMHTLFQRWRLAFITFITIQVLLGIFTVLHATDKQGLFIWLGVAHQFTAMLILIAIAAMLFLHQKKAVSVSA